jgi:NhaP-type Na+/H+ or K+/H+ antiporter
MVFYDTIVEFEDHGSIFKNLTGPLLHFLVILIGSTLVGMVIGFLSSVILRKISEFHKNVERIERGVLITFPWFAYMLCHVAGLSAIVVIFFVGISFSIYIKPYLSKKSKHFVHSFYEEVANVAENITFIFIGIAYFADHPYK